MRFLSRSRIALGWYSFYSRGSSSWRQSLKDIALPAFTQEVNCPRACSHSMLKESLLENTSSLSASNLQFEIFCFRDNGQQPGSFLWRKNTKKWSKIRVQKSLMIHSRNRQVFIQYTAHCACSNLPPMREASNRRTVFNRVSKSCLVMQLFLCILNHSFC